MDVGTRELGLLLLIGGTGGLVWWLTKKEEENGTLPPVPPPGEGEATLTGVTLFTTTEPPVQPQ